MELARDVDLMVVVGGRSSANTKELTRLCEIAGKPAIQIQGVADLSDADRLRRREGRRRDRRHVHADRGPARGRVLDPGQRRDPETQADAANLADAALAGAATPAGRTTSLPNLTRAVSTPGAA